MKKLSERELNEKIESFLTRKNEEVFHQHKRKLIIDVDRKHNFAVVKFA